MNFKIDPAGIAQVLNEAPAIAEQRARAQQTVDSVKRDGRRGQHGGTHIVDKIKVGDTRQTTSGAVTSIEWESSFWHFLEFGTVHMPPSRIATRSAQNAGLRVVERG